MAIVHCDANRKTGGGFINASSLEGRLDFDIIGALQSDMDSVGGLLIPEVYPGNFADSYCRLFKIHPLVKITSDYSDFPFSAINEASYQFGTIQYGFGFTKVEVEPELFRYDPINYNSQYIKYPVQAFPPFLLAITYPNILQEAFTVSFATPEEDTAQVGVIMPTSNLWFAPIPDLTATSITLNLRKNVVADLQYFYSVQPLAVYDTTLDHYEGLYTLPY